MGYHQTEELIQAAYIAAIGIPISIIIMGILIAKAIKHEKESGSK